jgi:hypothetical protein
VECFLAIAKAAKSCPFLRFAIVIPYTILDFGFWILDFCSLPISSLVTRKSGVADCSYEICFVGGALRAPPKTNFIAGLSNTENHTQDF